MSGEVKKEGKMTVFKSDRHEDWASMVFVGLVVLGVLLWMAYVVPDISFKAAADGKILSVNATLDQVVKPDDVLYAIETVEKKYVGGKLEEKVVQKDIKSKASGKILKILAKAGDAVKKGKDVIMVLEHVKGTLP
jgi:multidrug efflux pump subunit AcrA (membrane-fusion protein)